MTRSLSTAPRQNGRRAPRAGGRWLALLGAAALLLSVSRALVASEAVEQSAERFAVHGQLTYTEQESLGFHAPYQGPNSLSPGIGRETLDVTLYLGAGLWQGAELWLNPELDQGFGLDNTLGVAGFPSGEAYKVGQKRPYFRLPRAFIRQGFELGGVSTDLASAANQLAGVQSADRVVLTVGKFGVTDVFDTLVSAHDPRGDFLNWTAVDAGTFDYAADAWGYTFGATAEWYQGSWTLRGGAFDLSAVPNSEHLDPAGHQFQIVTELERRYALAGAPGRVLVTAYDSRGRMGLLRDAVAMARAGGSADIAALRKYRSRMGLHLALEQQVTADLGVFARLGSAAGNVEAYEFTDVDRALQAGLTLKGSGWGRGADTVGAVLLINAISGDRERYLGAGGLGILVGDGRLPHPGSEQIVESYYKLAVTSFSALTLDYQWIAHPGYNRDRGPVSVLALRAHLQF